MPNDLEYVVKDALMQCDKGSLPVPFSPTYNTHIKISGCLVATMADKMPMINIPSFGLCAARNGAPCTPIPITWLDTYKVKVKGQQTLLFKSKLPCGSGGKIKFITSGQVPIPPEEYEKLLDEHGEEEGGWGWWDTAELIPVVGSIIGAVREGAKGNWGMMALNIGFLAMDVAGLVSFGATTAAATAAKTGIKAGTKVAAKGAAKMAIKKGAGKAFASAVGKSVDKIALSKGIICVTACFPAGTLIATQEGQKPIEAIAVGDLVWAYDEKTGISALKPVLSTLESEVDTTLQLTLGKEVIETTVEHPFYTQTGWTPAGDLTLNDQVKTKNDTWKRVNATNFLYSKKKVYNFEVADFHTYFVGVWQWLVHNARPCLSKIKHLPPYIGSMWKGNYFDYIRSMFYKRKGGFNEVVLGTGKRLDSYIPKKEIISRKFSQLGEVSVRTAKGYIDEMVEKYAAGKAIKETARNAEAIAQGGKKLAGQMILEVPQQTKKIADEVLEYAKEVDVVIRDIKGKIYK